MKIKPVYLIAGLGGLMGLFLGLHPFEQAARSTGDVASFIGKTESSAPIPRSRDTSLRALSALSGGRKPASVQKQPDPYQGLELLDSYRTQPDSQGRFQIVKVYQRENNVYPLLRVKEHWVASPDGSSQQQVAQEMVGDHVLVRLKAGASADDLAAFAEAIGGSIKTRLQYSGLYVLQFNGQKADAMDQVMKQIAARPDLVSSSEPNYFMQLNR